MKPWSQIGPNKAQKWFIEEGEAWQGDHRRLGQSHTNLRVARATNMSKIGGVCDGVRQ